MSKIDALSVQGQIDENYTAAVDMLESARRALSATPNDVENACRVAEAHIRLIEVLLPLPRA